MNIQNKTLTIAILSALAGVPAAAAAATATTIIDPLLAAPTKSVPLVVAAPVTTPAPAPVVTVNPVAPPVKSVPVAAPVVAPAPVAAPAPVKSVPVATPVILYTGKSKKDHDDETERDDKDRDHKHGNHKDQDDKKMLSGTVTGNVLNVTSISSNFLKVGSKISGDGIPKGTRITGFKSGKGGIGTYTISTTD